MIIYLPDNVRGLSRLHIYLSNNYNDNEHLVEFAIYQEPIKWWAPDIWRNRGQKADNCIFLNIIV